MRASVLASCLLALSGCGYLVGGTWEDDPGNWRRAFESEKAAPVVVVHSRYWRSPHWSTEYEYFFQVRDDRNVRNEIVERYDLERSPETGADLDGRAAGAPGWFCPAQPGRYDGWRPREQSAAFRMYVDRETGDLFFTNRQL